jgi:thiamine-phosphate pyrophosphorylase
LLLYYISDRHQLGRTDQEQRRNLLLRIGEASQLGVDYIQLREKDLSIRHFEYLARDAVRCVREHGSQTKLLINSRIDVALAVEADGVHLTTTDIAASEARAIRSSVNDTRQTANWIIAVSCRTPGAVRSAESHGADFAVLAPIFEKAGTDRIPVGLEALRLAAGIDIPIDRRVEAGDNRNRMPVFALGGVTIENAQSCILAGASGVAGIRLFQQGDLRETVERLRSQ